MIKLLTKEQFARIDKNQHYAIRILQYSYGKDITLTTIYDCDKLNPIVAICQNDISTFCFLTLNGKRNPRFLCRGNNYDEELLLKRVKCICKDVEENLTFSKSENTL